AQFDPTVKLTARYDRQVSPLNRPIFGFGGVTIGEEPDTFDQNDTRFTLNLNQRLQSGGTYDLTLDTDRNSVAGQTSFLFNPSYTASLLFNLTQPLLRGFGPEVNRAPVHIARNTAAVEQYAFVDQVLTVIMQVEQAYWELVFARENEAVAKAALRAAQALLAETKAKVKAGLLADVEILQAEAGVADRVEQVLLAQQTVGDRSDRLRQLIVASEEELRQDAVVVPIDRPIRQADAVSASQALDLALRHRPEILQAQKQADNSRINVTLAENQLLPNLEFQGSVGLSGLGKKPEDMFERTFSTDFYSLGGGVVLSYPLGNRSAESQYRRRLLEAEQTRARIRQARQRVVVDVKEAIRRLRTNAKRMTTTKVARQLADRRATAERARFSLGLSTTRKVLESQRDLAEAQVKELRAVIDYNQALATYRRVTASSPDYYRITLQ
ncbi:MAG: TolC family protein, partial [Nitrospirae bacterium]